MLKVIAENYQMDNWWTHFIKWQAVMMLLMLINGIFSVFKFDEETTSCVAKIRIISSVLMRLLFLYKDVVYWYTFPHVSSFIAGLCLFLIFLPYYLVWITQDDGEYKMSNYLRRWVRWGVDYQKVDNEQALG